MSVSPIDDARADALLSGHDAGVSGAWAEVARVLEPLRERPGSTRPSLALLDRMQAATEPRRRAVLVPVGRRARVLAGSLAAALTAVLGFGGLAAANALPSGVQRFVSHALDQVGISVPLPHDHTSIVPGRGVVGGGNHPDASTPGGNGAKDTGSGATGGPSGDGSTAPGTAGAPSTHGPATNPGNGVGNGGGLGNGSTKPGNANTGGTNNGGTNNGGTNNPNNGVVNSPGNGGAKNPNTGGTNNGGAKNPNNGGTNNGVVGSPDNGGTNNGNGAGTPPHPANPALTAPGRSAIAPSGNGNGTGDGLGNGATRGLRANPPQSNPAPTPQGGGPPATTGNGAPHANNRP